MNIVKKIYTKIVRSYTRKRELQHVRHTLIKMHKYLLERRVKMLYVILPKAKAIKNLTSFEQDRIANWCFDFNKYKEELPKLRLLYGNDVTSEYILSVFDGGTVVQGQKRKILLDFESDHQHIINGRRVTIGQPAQFFNTIYTHGACTWRGTGVEDHETIASFLQSKINEIYRNCYRVVNSAIGRGSTIDDDFEIMKEQTFQPGDIVIVGSHGIIESLTLEDFRDLGIDAIETSSLFDRPHNYGEWFNDAVLHTNKRGNSVLATAIFNQLENLKWLVVEHRDSSSSRKLPKHENIESLTKGERIYGNNPELMKFIDSIAPHKKGDENSINGAIVMNCNPFTLGHRYLIEYAASKVDYLYIFVVEENKSFFPFEDRFQLVQQGTVDLPNVVVLPSGNFIISAVTFPGYFYKDDLKEAKIDCSNDLTVFAEYIAPTLNIKVRFAGEEPLDPVTRQYNEGMADILPKYGVKFCEIPRKEDSSGVGVISASRVRKLLKEKDFESMKMLVPQTTYDYLQNYKE